MGTRWPETCWATYKGEINIILKVTSSWSLYPHWTTMHGQPYIKTLTIFCSPTSSHQISDLHYYYYFFGKKIIKYFKTLIIFYNPFTSPFYLMCFYTTSHKCKLISDEISSVQFYCVVLIFLYTVLCSTGWWLYIAETCSWFVHR